MFKKILIANRGEIAVRIIRSCKELGIETVAVYSQVDSEALHVRLADEAYCIGPANPQQSYLQEERVLATAEIAGAEAIHPGYGFLSERESFASLCRRHDKVFIGPEAETMDLMGDKSKARSIMAEAGVPVVPGSSGSLEQPEEAEAVAEEIGYPLLIKASHGGGGRGMRVVHHREQLLDLISTARSESRAAFGSDHVYLEKYLEEPRHIEFQVLGDASGRVVELGERDCSLQRRHQKVLEEAPSTALDPQLRDEMGEMALRVARRAEYTGAGTVEFLLDARGNFYFIEMNTRIQVEHPVTEMRTGLDLIAEQIKIAAGEEISDPEGIEHRGAVIECRINAEDPDRNFTPSPGTIEELQLPGGMGVRIDSALYPGMEVSAAYDSLLAKLICWGRDRQEAINRTSRALDEFHIKGIKTNIDLHRRILNNAFFRRGEIYTNFIQRRL